MSVMTALLFYLCGLMGCWLFLTVGEVVAFSSKMVNDPYMKFTSKDGILSYVKSTMVPIHRRSKENPALYMSRRRRGRRGGQGSNGNDDYYYDDDSYNEKSVEDSLPLPRNGQDLENSKIKRVSQRRRVTRVQDDSEDKGLYDDETEISSEIDDDFVVESEFEYDDENDEVEKDLNIEKSSRTSRRGEYDDADWDEEEYFDYDDEYDEDDVDPAASGGNFWSNPTGGVDRPPPGFVRRDLNRPRLVNIPRKSRPQREYDGRPDYYVNDSRRTPRRGPAWRSPVRLGNPRPNPFIEQLYDKFFFYGFDMDDNASQVGDETVFGGTKGKFNGLKYLAISQGKNPSTFDKGKRSSSRPGSARGLPPSRRGGSDMEEDDYYEEGFDEDEGYVVGDSYPSQSVRNRYNRRVARGMRSTGRGSRRPRQEAVEQNYGYFNGRGRQNWVSEQVSAWFTDGDTTNGSYDVRFGDDDSELFDEPMDGRLQRQRRRDRQRSEWTPIGMIDSFLGVDREKMAFKAAEYDSKMGVRRSGTRTKRKRRERIEDNSGDREIQRRPGYAYRYDASLDDDDSPAVLDIDATVDVEEDTRKDTLEEPSATQGSDSKTGRNENPATSEKSWEERQAAVDRVPPADVPAWGPKGELPMNARQKAIEDALKDIQTAKRKLNEKVKREIRARDEVAILNVDAKALRLKIGQSRRSRSSQLDVEELRQIELEIEDASRVLRRARKRVDMAREELEELEERNHAVLGYYNPDQASKLVGDALNEFSGQVDSSSSVSPEMNGSASNSET